MLTRDARPGPADPARGVRCQRPAVGSAGELHLGAIGDARLLSRPGRIGTTGRATGRRAASRPGAGRDRSRGREDREAGGRLPVHRGPGLGRQTGYLLFSDPNANTIYRWSPMVRFGVPDQERLPGVDIGEYGQPGSNGLTLDREGRLTINEHGNRRVVRLEKNGTLTVLADRYRGQAAQQPQRSRLRVGRRALLHRPAVRAAEGFDDPRKELPFSGVYPLHGRDSCQLADQGADGPNGLAFSPDEKLPLRRQLGREEEGRDAVRRAAGRNAVATARCSST